MDIAPFNPASALAGGVLIGCAAALLLWGLGRVAGISGIVGGLLATPSGDTAWRLSFVGGLALGGAIFAWAPGIALAVQPQVTWPGMITAGLLVGSGTRIGSGCTSGHGVCGMARGSGRSFVATATFMAVAFATVFVMRHLLGMQP